MAARIRIEHPGLGLDSVVDDLPGVREHFEARGWVVAGEAADPDLTDEQLAALAPATGGPAKPAKKAAASPDAGPAGTEKE